MKDGERGTRARARRIRELARSERGWSVITPIGEVKRVKMYESERENG